jgi:hypothetical protein
MPTSMHVLADLALRHGADVEDSRSATSGIGESLPVAVREQMLEEALASEDADDDVPRTMPYASGSRIPSNIAEREYRLTSAPEDAVQIRAIKLIDAVETSSVVYRYQVDGFHAWVRLLKALIVRKPLDFGVEQEHEVAPRTAG